VGEGGESVFTFILNPDPDDERKVSLFPQLAIKMREFMVPCCVQHKYVELSVSRREIEVGA